MDKSGQATNECWREPLGIDSKTAATTLRLTAEMLKNLSALSGVAYEKLGAIFLSQCTHAHGLQSMALNIRSDVLATASIKCLE